MTTAKEIRSCEFTSRYGHSNLVSDKDKYLFAQDPPSHRFAVTGTGTVGLEHIRATMLEGWVTICESTALSVGYGKRPLAACLDETLTVCDSLQAVRRPMRFIGVPTCSREVQQDSLTCQGRKPVIASQ